MCSSVDSFYRQLQVLLGANYQVTPDPPRKELPDEIQPREGEIRNVRSDLTMRIDAELASENSVRVNYIGNVPTGFMPHTLIIRGNSDWLKLQQDIEDYFDRLSRFGRGPASQ